MNIYPTPYIYFRKPSLTVLPATLLPANCDPSSMGIQISSVPVWQLSGTPTLEFAMTGKGANKVPAPLLDMSNPWSLQGCEVRVYFDTRTNRTTSFKTDGTTAGVSVVFVGDVHEIRPHEAGGNPWYAYSFAARGLVSRAERISVVSPINGSDIARFNMNAIKADYEPQVSGKTVGEALQMLLEDYGTAYQMNEAGIGYYTFNNNAETASLPQQTLDDISKLTLITPFEFRITGDNIVAGIEQMLAQYCPNYMMTIQANGMIRFFDIRVIDPYEIDLTSDTPVDGFVFTKSTLSSYSDVVVQGGPKIVPYYCQWNLSRAANVDDSGDAPKVNASLIESFDYTGVNTLGAKQAFNWADYTFGRFLISVGDVSFKTASGVDLPSNQVRLIPSSDLTVDGTNPNLRLWAEDELILTDASILNRRDCRLTVSRTVIKNGDGTSTLPDQTVSFQSGVFLPTSNTAVSNGSSIVVTSPLVDRAPTFYQIGTAPGQYRIEYKYRLHGWTPSGSVCWRRYKVQLDPSTNPNHTKRRLGTFFSDPPMDLWYSNSTGKNTAENRTRLPRCLVEYAYPAGSGVGYGSFFCGFRIDPANSLIFLDRPSAIEHKPSGIYEDLNPPWAWNQPFTFVPYNVKAVLPVYDGTYEAVYPPSGSTIKAPVKTNYGMSRTLTVSLPEWQDGRDQSYADLYAKEIWDTVSQPQVEGSFVWVTGHSSDWSIYGIKNVADTTTNRYKPVLQGFRVTNSSDCDSKWGSGVEDVTLFATSITVKFASDHAPMTEVTFAASKPRFGPAMHKFHSFEEALQRDGITGASYSANAFVGAVFEG